MDAPTPTDSFLFGHFQLCPLRGLLRRDDVDDWVPVNLALRLVALGYTQVYWYRGGREAWEVAGMPETDINLQEW